MSPPVTLVIPGLSSLLSNLLIDARSRETIPGFYRFFSKASRFATEAGDPYLSVATQTGLVTGGVGQFSHAAYRQYAVSREITPDIWLNVSPVSYTSASSGLILHKISGSQLSQDEQSQITDLLQSTSITIPNVPISANGNAVWLLNAAQRPDIKTDPLYEVDRRPVALHMPTGRDVTFWAQRQAEWEMMLHAHPLNKTRVNEDLPPVSSFWLWGEGSLPDKMPPPDLSHSVQLIADDPALTGMALFHDINVAGFSPENVDLSANAVVAADFSLITAGLDSDALMDWLVRLDADWVRWAMRQLGKGKLASIQLADPAAGVSWRLGSFDLKKFWRNKPRLKIKP